LNETAVSGTSESGVVNFSGEFREATWRNARMSGREKTREIWESLGIMEKWKNTAI
jgi:hypothetical protein